MKGEEDGQHKTNATVTHTFASRISRHTIQSLQKSVNKKGEESWWIDLHRTYELERHTVFGTRNPAFLICSVKIPALQKNMVRKIFQ